MLTLNCALIFISLISIGTVTGYRPNYPTPRSANTFYDGCGSSKLCFGHPSPCLKTKNCTHAVAVNVNSNVYTFELIGRNSPGYVAVGLSSDKNMGSDSAMECQQRNGNVDLYSSWTFPKRDLYVTRSNVPQNITRLTEKSFVNGVLYCRFTRDVRSVIYNTIFDLSKDKYVMLLVSGNNVTDTNVGFHDNLYITTSSKVSLSSGKELYADPKVLFKLHGTFMLIAWLTLANCGIMMARYFKRDWIGHEMCGKDQWFAWHQILMIGTWLLTMAAFIIIFVEVGGWVNPSKNTHAILGIITIVICFFQPIGAIFRPEPDDERRIVFNVIHKSCGSIASILGIITLFFSVSLSRLNLPKSMTYVLVGFVVFHLIIHTTLFIMDNYRDGRFEYENVFQMYNNKDNDVNARMPHQTADEYINKSIIRQILLGIYISINVAFLIGILCLIWLSPSY